MLDVIALVAHEAQIVTQNEEIVRRRREAEEASGRKPRRLITNAVRFTTNGSVTLSAAAVGAGLAIAPRPAPRQILTGWECPYQFQRDHDTMPAVSSRRTVSPHTSPSLSPSDRVLQLLAAVAQHGSAMPVKRLAEVAKLPTSTVYRHLGVLKRWGFVAEGERDGTYEPGPMSLQLGWGGQTSQLVKTAHDELQRLVETTGESAGLMVTINGKLVCLDLVESPQSLRCSVRRGSSLPLVRGASAKAQLAFLPERDRHAVLDLHFGAAERAKRLELERELTAIRQAGYAVSESEVDWGVWGVSVPLMNRHERLLGGITLMAPSMRVDRKHKSLINATVSAAGRIAGRF